MKQAFSIKIKPYQLNFKKPAKTSRGEYKVHQIWYVIVQSKENINHWGVGECAPLYDLSCDYSTAYQDTLINICHKIEQEQLFIPGQLRIYPSMLFGLETAFQHFYSKDFRFQNSDFNENKKGIPINGLIWMSDFDNMFQQIEEKIKLGFRCIKLKIGAIDFDKEIALLKYIRASFSKEQIILRVDANGAFSPKDAMKKLEVLAKLDIHSIEQPIKANQWDEMAKLTKSTPIPIALDEELIGIHEYEKKKQLIDTIQPQYIILKPTLHGGILGCEEWIKLAKEASIDWWATSALESNIGLNAIAQWVDNHEPSIPQGLGTGGLYTNNITMPLYIKGDCLFFNNDENLYPKLDFFLNGTL